MEMTFAMIKPNGVASGLIGRLIERYESARLSVCAIKMHQMTSADARGFYAEHVEKPFFGELEEYMTKGPSIMLVLGGENAVAQDEKVPRLHAEVVADAVHGLFDAKDLGAVFQQDVAGLHGRFQDALGVGRRGAGRPPALGLDHLHIHVRASIPAERRADDKIPAPRSGSLPGGRQRKVWQGIQVVRGGLVDEIIEPVGIEQVGA